MTLSYRISHEIAYELLPIRSNQKRLIEHIRTLYRRDDLTGRCRSGNCNRWRCL
jgi:hypothetical protein